MDKEDDEETLGDFILRTLDETFIDNIPMDAIKDLPKFYMYFFGAIFELLSFAMLGYFMYTGYQQGVTSKFISITADSGQCSEITRAVTGNFKADESGIWVGAAGFDFSSALYSMHLDEAEMTETNYDEIMTYVESELQALANISKSMSLDVNLVTWMSWQFICDSTVTDSCADFDGQVFAFAGDAQYVLSLSYIDTTLSNEFSDCTSQSLSSYDLSNAINNGEYNAQEFTNNPTCKTIVDPVNMGYNSKLDGEVFGVNYDVRTLVEAIAVNMGILTVSALTKISGAPTHYFMHNGYNYTGNYFVDPVYAGMHPFYCVVNQLEGVSNVNPPPFGVGSLCFISQGNITGVPIFTHYGAGTLDGDPEDNAPKPCECDKYGHEPECDVFNLITGYMFFDGMSMTDVVNVWLNVTVDNGGAFRMNQNAYNASWAAAASTYAPNVSSVYTNNEWRQSAYDFCRTDDFGSCSILAINSYGSSVFDQALTEYLFLLTDGSCSEQFVIDPNAFARMIAKPPTPIVETYFDCVMYPSDSLMNAAGVASGNVSLIVPLIVLAFLPFMYFWLTITGNVQSKPEYEEQELDSALQLLALQVLRIRDNHLRGMKKDGLLITLTREMVHSARNADGTAVDSDDSDDDEDNTPAKRTVTKRASSRTQVPVEPTTTKRGSVDSTNNTIQAPVRPGAKRGSVDSTNDTMNPLAPGADSDDEEGGVAHPDASPARPARRMSLKQKRQSRQFLGGDENEKPAGPRTIRRMSSVIDVDPSPDVESGFNNPSMHDDL